MIKKNNIVLYLIIIGLVFYILKCSGNKKYKFKNISIYGKEK